METEQLQRGFDMLADLFSGVDTSVHLGDVNLLDESDEVVHSYTPSMVVQQEGDLGARVVAVDVVAGSAITSEVLYLEQIDTEGAVVLRHEFENPIAVGETRQITIEHFILPEDEPE